MYLKSVTEFILTPTLSDDGKIRDWFLLRSWNYFQAGSL